MPGAAEARGNAAADQPAGSTIVFDAGTASGDRVTRTTTGTFVMTGRFRDAGIIRTSYRFAGARIDATATLIGGRGMFALSLRGSSGPMTASGQGAAGRWRVCGGTGAYRHLHGYGRWETDSDFGSVATSLSAPTVSGTFIGRLYRSSGRRHAAAS
jgi:hypothetical protein